VRGKSRKCIGGTRLLLNGDGGPELEMEGLPATNHGVDNPVPLADDDLMLKISEDEGAIETFLGCELEAHDHGDGTAGYYYETHGEHCRHGAATVVGNVGGPRLWISTSRLGRLLGHGKGRRVLPRSGS